MADAETTAFAAAFYGGFVNDELHKRGMSLRTSKFYPSTF